MHPNCSSASVKHTEPQARVTLVPSDGALNKMADGKVIRCEVMSETSSEFPVNVFENSLFNRKSNLKYNLGTMSSSVCPVSVYEFI